MRTLALDLETYSSISLTKAGVYAYTSATDFEILLLAYAFDEEEVEIVDLAQGETVPNKVLSAIQDKSFIKTAFNASFERTALSRHLGIQLTAEDWRCSEVQVAMLSLPLSLEAVGEVLGLEKQKLKEGKELIRYFCMPCKPTRTNENRTRNLPIHAQEKWEQFKYYCKRDVKVERAIRKKLASYPISETEQKLYVLDQEINDRGILVDTQLVRNAIKGDSEYKEKVTRCAQALTGLDNPNSVAQLKTWLSDNDLSIKSLSKKLVGELVTCTTGQIKQLLEMRLELAKTSVKKYEAIDRAICPDKRVRGLLQFYGANRTGRWAGRLVQVHNLPQNHLKDLTLARNLVKQGNLETLELLYDSVPNVLSELIRTAFIPSKGRRFIVADFSAIEARVIAWLANEAWRLEVFKTHGKIYEASASQMFKVPIEEITKGSPLRQKGKIAELALGYGGSVGALTSMGALEMGLDENELKPLVTAWREANPNITRLWWTIDKAALKAVKERVPQAVGKLTFYYERGILFITLPSGRKLSYIRPRIEINKFGREGLTYEGIGENKHWCRIETYGPKLVENIVQATARDLLAEAMLAIRDRGYEIVMHVHDEVVVEAPIGKGSLEELCEVMAIPPKWAEDLPLRADGFECEYYRKD